MRPAAAGGRADGCAGRHAARAARVLGQPDEGARAAGVRQPKTSPSAENPDELSDAPEPGGPIPDAPADAPQEDVPWLAPDYHEVVYKTCHPIDVKEANEGEHGFLYGVIRNGKLHMQMIPIPEAGIPEMWFQDSPIRSMYFMSLRFMSGGFRKEGRSWVKDPLDPVDVEFGKVPIVPDGGEP